MPLTEDGMVSRNPVARGSGLSVQAGNWDGMAAQQTAMHRSTE